MNCYYYNIFIIFRINNIKIIKKINISFSFNIYFLINNFSSDHLYFCFQGHKQQFSLIDLIKWKNYGLLRTDVQFGKTRGHICNEVTEGKGIYQNSRVHRRTYSGSDQVLLRETIAMGWFLCPRKSKKKQNQKPKDPISSTSGTCVRKETA